jgi:D-sedoheptulose 7-phosphate isomerase
MTALHFCETLGLCGLSGGRLKQAAKYAVRVVTDDTQPCDDVHAIFGHMVMKALCYPEYLA